MAAVTFDTHKFIKTLEAAGMPIAQAEAMSVAVRESHDATDLATKADLRACESGMRFDLKRLEQRLDARIDQSEARLDSKIDKLELRMTIKLGTMLVAAVGLFAGVTLSLIHI